MFDDSDPVLARLREICLALPGAAEKVSHGAPNFFTVKVFASYGAHIKGDHANQRHSRAVQFKPDEQERLALLEDSRFFAPAYSGPSGWLAIDLTLTDTNWTEIAELVDLSYRQTAPKKLIAELDARTAVGS